MGLRTFGTQLKALVRKELSFFPQVTGGVGSLFLGMSSRSQYNYSRDVGDGLLSSVVMPAAQWIMRAFPEAPLVVRRRQADKLEIIEGHPLAQLVERPNDFYPGALLWMATSLDWVLWGESYWRIIFDRGSTPVELWWIPPWSMTPRWPQDGSVFISHYDYHPDQRSSIRLEREEVLHFRHGIDPHQPRHGLPPLRAIIQDIWVDAESNHFVGAMLRNMGIPGLIISPKHEEGTIGDADVELIKAYIESRFSGDQRGRPLAMGRPTDVQKLSFSPTDLDMASLRSTAEERVSAALGISSAVIGFKAGLESTKVGATMREYIRLSWSNGIVPVQRLMAAELQRVLLPHFEADPEGLLVGWNYDEVEALQESQDELAKRYALVVTSGILKVSEGRQALGYTSTPEDEIYLRPNNLTPTDPKDQMPEPEPVVMQQVLPAANGNGNGMSNGNRNRNDAVQQRSLKQGGTLEDFIHGIIQRQARRIDEPPQALLHLANRIWKEEQAAQSRWQDLLIPVFADYSAMVAVAAREVLIPKKQDLADIINTSVILERIPLVSVRAELTRVYAKLYEEMVDLTLNAMSAALQSEPTDPSRIHAQVQAMALERVALLDLTTEARTSILNGLEQARIDGLDEDAMIRLLSDSVPAGRWTSVDTRAQIIARSESRFASNIATSTYARQIGAQLLVFDARLGHTDAICEERNGWVVSPSEALLLSQIEHANGTLGFAPLTASGVQARVAIT